MTTYPAIPSHTELVGRARELRPLLRRHASEGEINRRLSDEVIDAMTDAGLFRLFTPHKFGGYAVPLHTLVEVTATLAHADGSAAWVVGIAAAADWGIAHASTPAQEEVYGGNPDARAAGSFLPSPASRVEGGVRVDGRWGYASGSPHADWAVIGTTIASECGTPDGYLALVPRSDIAIEDTWHTVGMRGTGSHTWLGEDVVVPEYRLTQMNDLIEGTPGHEEPLYRLPIGPIGPSTLTGTLLGLGRAALDFVIENCASKAVTHTVYTRQSDSVAVQTQIAQAALKIDTARLHSIAIVNKLDAAANTSGTIDDAARAWMRASSGYAVQQVLDAIQLLLSVHGSASFAESSPLQRIWRDANMAGRHAGLNAAVGYEVLGKALLAVPEQITPMV